MKKYYITTPIYYVNDQPHIGHLYTSVSCDVLARFYRMLNYEVLFLTGTDEHGQKISDRAKTLNMTPKDLCDENCKNFMHMNELFGISCDKFIRTTSEEHKKFVTDLWQTLVNKNHIYLGFYEGWYSVSDEAFFSANEVEEINGEHYSKSGAKVELIKEESYFFRLTSFRDKLLKIYKENPEIIAPSFHVDQLIKYVENDLSDLSVSRKSVKWGIKVPNNTKIKINEQDNNLENEHTIYVWIDALANYLSGINYKIGEKNFWWPANLHMVGKDIIKFHGVYWPAILMAAEIPLPKRIFAHGWWKIEGKKMSKSLGNVVSPDALANVYTVDGVRYGLLRDFKFGSDGNFSSDILLRNINGELVNCIGNGFHRTVRFVYNNFSGKIPNEKILKNEIYLRFRGFSDKVEDFMNSQEFFYIIQEILSMTMDLNKFIEESAPWKLIKSSRKKAGEVLITILECLKYLSYYLYPFIPSSAEKMFYFLGIEKSRQNYTKIHECLTGGDSLVEPEPIFRVIKDE